MCATEDASVSHNDQKIYVTILIIKRVIVICFFTIKLLFGIWQKREPNVDWSTSNMFT